MRIAPTPAARPGYQPTRDWFSFLSGRPETLCLSQFCCKLAQRIPSQSRDRQARMDILNSRGTRHVPTDLITYISYLAVLHIVLALGMYLFVLRTFPRLSLRMHLTWPLALPTALDGYQWPSTPFFLSDGRSQKSHGWHAPAWPTAQRARRQPLRLSVRHSGVYTSLGSR